MNTATASAVSTRFMDNTTTNPIDRIRVYGFAPGLKYMPVRGLVANRAQIGQGQLVLFLPRAENYLDSDLHRQSQEFSPRSQARAVQAKYTNGEAGDCGFRILDMLTELPYDKTTGEDLAERYFATVHPNRIGPCEMGLETNVGGDWELSGGSHSTAIRTPLARLNPNEPSNPCATCRVAWLQSDECTNAMIESGLDYGVLDALRQRLLDSYSAFITFAKRKLESAKADVARASSGAPGKAGLDESDWHYMNVTHEKAIHIQQAELVTAQAEAQGRAMAGAIADAMRGGFAPTPNTPTVSVSGDSAEIAELKRQLAEKDALLASAMQNVTARASESGPAQREESDEPDVTVATDDLADIIAAPTRRRRR